MAKIYCKSSYLLRRDTAENWQNKNPILRKGEQGLETDTGIIKIGDGVTEYNSLSDDNIYFPKSRINKSVDDVKSYANNNFANALKGSKSGSAILINDVSPVTHEMGVKVRSKNLIPYPYLNSTKTIAGITFTVSSDGSITANGTATSNAYFEITSFSTFYIPEGNYILSGCPSGGSSTTYNLTAVNGSGISYTKFSQDIGNGISLSSSGEYWIITCRVMAGQTVNNLTFRPQLELGTTATAYTPYIPDLTAVKVSRCGKNLLPYPYTNTTKTQNGITFTDNGDGSITISGKAERDAYFYLCTVDFGSNNMWNESANSNGYYVSGCKHFFYNKSNKISVIIVPSGTDYSTNPITVKPQIELGTTATAYEPYITPTEYTPAADGTVNGVTSLYPNTTLTTDTDGVIIDCEYNRDINKAFAELQQAIISSGGNV